MPYAITINPDGTTSCRAIGTDDPLMPGEVFADAQPDPTLADIASTLQADVQRWIDQTATVNGYDSLASCISYKDSAIAQWAADAVAAIAWRDAVWAACFQWQQSAAQSPPPVIPTSDEVISQLPQPSSFGWITHLPGQPQA